MNEEAKHTDYRLEVWNGKEYIRTYAYSDGSRDQHNDVIRALMRSNEGLMADPDLMTYRIVRCDKKRTMKPKRKDMNFGSTTGRRNLGDSISVLQQAQAAADHYINLRDHHDTDTLTDVPVYPVKLSGRGLSNEFRGMLAGLLVGDIRPTNGHYWGNTIGTTRKLIEAKLADHGFQFTEVDLENYS